MESEALPSVKSNRKGRITHKLIKVGAAWATSSVKYISPNDPMDDQTNNVATYHIHPDVGSPVTGNILRFKTLDAVEEWVDKELLLPLALEAAVVAAQKVGGPHPAPDALLSALEWDGEVLVHTATLMRVYADPWMTFKDPDAAFTAAQKEFWKVLRGPDNLGGRA